MHDRNTISDPRQQSIYYDCLFHTPSVPPADYCAVDGSHMNSHESCIRTTARLLSSPPSEPPCPGPWEYPTDEDRRYLWGC